LFPNCAKNHRRASAITKNFPTVIRRGLPLQGKRRKERDKWGGNGYKRGEEEITEGRGKEKQEKGGVEGTEESIAARGGKVR
jgi:hypothetical protein